MEKRNLYLTNIPVEEALERFQNALSPHLKIENEDIEVIHSLDRVTAEAVFARVNSPLYDCAAMDGAAVVSAHTLGAGEASPLTLKQGGDFMAVDTGDPIRPPFDAVIMAEDIQEKNGGKIVIRSSAAPWQHVRPVGEDVVQGEMILPGGHKIRPIDVGVLLSGGITRILARRRPEVAVIPTGSEMTEPGEELKEGGVIESNSRMLEALVRQCGGVPSRFAPVPDEYGLIKERLKDAAERFDMVLVTAGTSAGRGDYTVHALRELGEVAVHGVAMKPGKPVILAVVNGKPVVGIPGYPVSAYLAYENFAAPILKFFSGVSGLPEAGAPVTGMPVVRAVLTRRLVSSLKYREYVRVKVGKIGERLVASPLARGAGAAMSLVRADGFCVIDQDSEGVEAGTEVNVALCRGLDGLENTVVSVGSHDLILDVIADMMPNVYHGTRLSSTHVGSMGGLLALKNGEAHIAPTHLLDEETGVYNVPAVKKLFAGRRMALIKGVGRAQGIMVKKGNPLGIAGIEDLSRSRYVNRQRGAGTRVLLDYRLKAVGIDPSGIVGYEREAATHMAVAAAVKDGGADAGMGILSAARAMDLDFIPIGSEEYDFAVPTEFLELAHIRAFIGMLKHPDFRRKLEELGGYTVECCGEVVFLP
ncbi:MAG: molybdopterin biosynthesis protein [Synergistaceae bacterium]|nr:molybdopterin biosynthesis protein [Synergistaceae bacterium]